MALKIKHARAPGMNARAGGLPTPAANTAGPFYFWEASRKEVEDGGYKVADVLPMSNPIWQDFANFMLNDLKSQ